MPGLAVPGAKATLTRAPDVGVFGPLKIWTMGRWLKLFGMKLEPLVPGASNVIGDCIPLILEIDDGMMDLSVVDCMASEVLGLMKVITLGAGGDLIDGGPSLIFRFFSSD